MPRYNGPVIDTHHHLWRADNGFITAPVGARMYAEDAAPIRRPYPVEELVEDFGDHKIVKSVHVQTNGYADPMDEPRWLQQTADRAGYPHGIVAYADMTDPNLGRHLDALAKLPNMRGVRHQLCWDVKVKNRYVDRPDLCWTPEFRRGVAMLKDYDFSFDLQGFPLQFSGFADLIRANPKTKFALIHAGHIEDTSAEGIAYWRDGLRWLVDLPNLHVKCSGLNMFARNLDPNRINIALATVIAMFGLDRCFYGSNFPMEKIWVTYDAYISAYKDALAHMPEADQRAFFHDNGARFYRL